MFTIIENGQVYAPEKLGETSILVADGKIGKIGKVDRQAIAALGVEYEVIDAGGCLVTPGLIDPHQHLLGGSGEEGFSTQTPEISAGEIIAAGITTVAGCLGVDTTMKTMAGLLAKTKALKEEGLHAYMWSGGYTVPPTTITSSVRDDIMFIDEVIGAGEIAIADERSTEPTDLELARVAHDAYIGGMLSKKAGLVHFHVGESEVRLQLLRDLIEKHDVKPEWLYPTHINRSDELMKEAIELAKQGCYVDIDTVDEDAPEKLKFYFKHKGPPDKLTLSSDASKTSPSNLFGQVKLCILEHGFPVEQVLPLVSTNTAKALKFKHLGSIEVGKMGELLVIDKKTFELREVLSAGRRLLKEGELNFSEAFLKDSNREVTLIGEKSKTLAKRKTASKGKK